MSEAIRIYRHGGPEVLCLEEEEVGPPEAGEVQLLQTAIGLNFVDTYYRSGLYPMPLPSGLGMEGAGVITQLGAGVEGLREGEWVAYAWGPLGAYAKRRNIAARHVLKLPPWVKPETAALVLLKGLTAEFLLFRLRGMPLLPGASVLITAAAGGVGSLLCRWARACGLRVFGVVGAVEKVEKAKEAGCEEVWLGGEAFSEGAKEATSGEGVEAVFDGTGKAGFREALACLKPRGLMVSYGNASGAVEAISPLELASGGSLVLTRPRLLDYIAKRSELEAGAARLFEALKAGHIEARCEQRWALSEAAKAHEALEARRTQGLSLLYT